MTAQVATEAEPTLLERLHALEIVVARVVDERNAAVARAELAERAGEDIARAVATGLLREADLEARLGHMTASFEGCLERAYLRSRTLSNRVLQLLAENAELRTELSGAGARRRNRWRRRSPSAINPSKGSTP